MASRGDDDLLTAAQVAELLQVTAETVMRWARRGLLPRHQIAPHVIRFRRSDVLSFIESMKGNE